MRRCEAEDAVEGVNNIPWQGWHKEVLWRKDGTKGDANYYAPDGTMLRSTPDVRRYLQPVTVDGEGAASIVDYWSSPEAPDLSVFSYKVSAGDQNKFKRAPRELMERKRARKAEFKKETEDMWNSMAEGEKKEYQDKALEHLVPVMEVRGSDIISGPRLGPHKPGMYNEDFVFYDDKDSMRAIQKVVGAKENELPLKRKREVLVKQENKTEIKKEKRGVRSGGKHVMTCDPDQTFYEAEPDETCKDIAFKFSVSLDVLLAENKEWYSGLTSKSRLKEGTR